MHPYTLLLAIASLMCAGCGGALFLQDRERRANQLAGLLGILCAHWAICQALITVTYDRHLVSDLTAVSAPGWLFLGAMILHIAMETAGSQQRGLRWLRDGLYLYGLLLMPVIWFSDVVVRPAQRVEWGWTFQYGTPLLVLSAGSLAALIGAGHCLRRAAHALSEAERRQLPWVGVAGIAQISLTTVSDILLPAVGIPCPPLGILGIAALAGISVWVVNHFGFSLMTPAAFSHEILRLLPDGVAMLRPDGRIRSANEGLARLAAVSLTRLEGMQISELLTWSFDAAEHDEVDCELRTAGGGRLPVAVTSELLRDRQGNELGHVIVVRDLREVADLRHRLVTSARLAAVGELAAGIAHEINNPMAFVRSNLSQLEGRWKEVREELTRAGRTDALREALGDVDELLADSLEGVDRAAEIVRGVRNFAHPGHDGRESVDLHRLLEDALRLISPQLRGRAEVVREFGDLPEVEGVPQQLRQVFVNLLLNASQAISPGGRIWLATGVEGSRALVTVEDDGPGIPTEIIDRIFDPFFTTKPVGEGTGLGLGIAYQIVRSHGGAIRVDSAPGRGAKFSVELPLSQA